MTIVELITFFASEAYIRDPSLFKPYLDVVSKVDGHIDTYYGVQIEDKSTGYILTLWESLESHEEQPKYKDFLESLRPAWIGSPSILHIDTPIDPTTAFQAPISEIANVIVNPGNSIEEAAPLLDKIVSKSVGNIPIGPTWGRVKEVEGRAIIFVGWNGLDAHEEHRKNPVFHKAITGLREIAFAKALHTKLIKN